LGPTDRGDLTARSKRRTLTKKTGVDWEGKEKNMDSKIKLYAKKQWKNSKKFTNKQIPVGPQKETQNQQTTKNKSSVEALN